MFQLLPNTPLARIVHAVLHQRMVTFAEKYTPLDIAEVVVTRWLNRFYCGDPDIIIMVQQDEGSFNLVAHAVIEIQQIGEARVVCGHQLEFDRKFEGGLEEFMKLLDDLTVHIGAVGVCIEVSKNVKVFERKYGYTNTRTLMYKGNISKVQVETELEKSA